MDLNEKLNVLRRKVEEGRNVTIALLGLGSVGCYLLDYLLSLTDPQLRIVVVGRHAEKMQQEVNLIRTAAVIRRQLRSRIEVEGGCDFLDPASIEAVLRKIQPDFMVNCSRLYPGLKYGSLSWTTLRAYGIWAPLSVLLGKNMMEAYGKAGCRAIGINTSYPDAVIPWLKSAGMPYFDLGSGNLNHLVARMKFFVAGERGIDNIDDIDISLAASHFHDVVLSREGHTEGVNPLLSIRYQGKDLPVDREAVLRACAIPMPSDQKRNRMNASSNLDIICSILAAIREKKAVKIHTPGVDGHMGGYPFIIDGTGNEMKAYFAPDFPLEEMERVNRESIYCDGIEQVTEGTLVYTDELLAKVKQALGVSLPKEVPLSEAPSVARLLIEKIIEPNS